MNDQDLGLRIKLHRTARRIQQTDLAQRLGISQPYLSLIEKGERPVDSELLGQIATALECRPEDLTNERRKIA